MERDRKDKVIVGVSIASFVVGVILTFLGLLLPPMGVIDNSVLVAVGQFLTLAATGLGVKEYIDGKILTAEVRRRNNEGGSGDA